MAELPPQEPVALQPQSEKALGKRKLDDTPVVLAALVPGKNPPNPAPKPLKLAATRDKRVTRSSLGGGASAGGPSGSREGSVAQAEALTPLLYLPANTPILLTIRAPANLVHHPPLVLPPEPTPAPVPPPPAGAPVKPEIPPFRLLDPVGESFGRSRHAVASEVDTSDAHYHRLHRFPEVLEKRSARLERDRLIHERSKLINELEELRGRGWVYHGAQGGKGEEERRRRIKAGEERLKRYDALLPNQPRKSNFLNGGNGPSHLDGGGGSRSGSPAPTAAAVASSSSRGPRHSTPVSATTNGGTTIKIKFGMQGLKGRPSATASALGPVAGTSSKGRARVSYAYTEADEEDELESDVEWGGSSTGVGGGKAAKRDRKAERVRAAERLSLGLAPRALLPSERVARIAAGGKGKKKARRTSKGKYEELDSDEDDSELSDDDESFDDEEPRAPKRLRLRDSFFHTTTLRDAFFPASMFAPEAPNKPATSRRSSSRIAYAFGQRLPEAALLQHAEFELHGGVAEELDMDTNPPFSQRRLEHMLLERMGGDGHVVWEGRVVPRSAIEVMQRGPILVKLPVTLPPPAAVAAPVAAPLPPPPARVITAPPPPTVAPVSRPPVDVSVVIPARPRRSSTAATNRPSLPISTAPTPPSAPVAMRPSSTVALSAPARSGFAPPRAAADAALPGPAPSFGGGRGEDMELD